MTRRTAILLHLATFALAVTGLVYAAMHYLMKPVDPFSVVNHPLEPYMLQAHIAAAPVLVFLVGAILHSHIFLKLDGGSPHGRRSGLLLGLLFGVMALSGSLLQVFTTTGHQLLFWLHLATGVVWALGYAVHQVISRKVRRILQTRTAQAVVILVILLVALFTAEQLFAEEAPPLDREVYAMGTTLHMTLYGGDTAAQIQESECIVRSVEQTEDELSTWRKASALSLLNRQPMHQPMTLSPSLCDVLKRTIHWTDETGGAFDPGMGRLGEAWGIHDRFRIPSAGEIRKALEVTGMAHLQIRKSCEATREADILIDPGAFGKGEALDRAAAGSSTPMVLNFGGQILIHGRLPDGPAEVLLADPRDRSLPSPLSVRISSGSLSTSGGSERDGVVDGRRISHILDPRTGQPAASFGSVTVWSPTGFDADVLSTALYVMGPVEGLRWAEKNGVAACFLVVDKTGVSVRKSAAFTKIIY